MKRIVIVSDLQVPFHDRHAVKNLASFIAKFKPHEVVTIGDEIDFNTNLYSPGFTNKICIRGNNGTCLIFSSRN